MPARFDMTDPANQARLDAVEQLEKVADQAGLTMIQLALGFVTAHPGVTSEPRASTTANGGVGDFYRRERVAARANVTA
jgi:aryl-alcohol dehydrogenase-like predicted oxidoreductase